MPDDVCEVIVTAPDADWLAAFTRELVEQHLAACGHTITPIRSIYRWQGRVHDEFEARVALHTRTNLVEAIARHADAKHPYDVACVAAVPIVDGSPDYLAWIRRETRAAPDTSPPA